MKSFKKRFKDPLVITNRSQLPPAEAGGLARVGWKPTGADIIRLP